VSFFEGMIIPVQVDCIFLDAAGLDRRA
jgi:hypothetical protein